MKRLAFAPLALLLIGSANAQTFGYDPISRGSLDLAYQISYIDSGIVSPSAGRITSWDLYAADLGDVTLQMFRPTVSGYQLIGENDVTISTAGLNHLAISFAQQIVIEAGDVIGFRYNQTFFGNRVIAFDQNQGGTYRFTNWPDGGANDVPIGGEIASSALLGAGEQRRYSLSATVDPVPEPASLLVLGLGALALRKRRA